MTTPSKHSSTNTETETRRANHGFLVRDRAGGVIGAGRTNTGAMTVASQACMNRGAEPDTWTVQKVSMQAAAAALGFLMLDGLPRVLERLRHSRRGENGGALSQAFCIAGAWVTSAFSTDRRILVGMNWPIPAGTPEALLPNCPDCEAENSLTPAPEYTDNGAAVRCTNCDSRFAYPGENSKTDLTLMNEPTGPDQAWVVEHDGAPKGIGPTVDEAIRDAEQRSGEAVFAARKEHNPQLLKVTRKKGRRLEDAWNSLQNIVLSDAGAVLANELGTRRPPVGVPIEIENIEKLTEEVFAMDGRNIGHETWRFQDSSILRFVRDNDTRYVILG